MQQRIGRHPYLAKLWWVSVPVFIAGQSIAIGQAPSGEPGIGYQPEVFWSLEEENGHSFNQKVLKGALDEGNANPWEGKASRPASIVKQKEKTPSQDLNWIKEEESRSERFAVPDEALRQCQETREGCAFPGYQKCAARSRGQYLCAQELVRKVQCVASSCHSALGRKHHTCSWEPCHSCTRSQWIRGHYAHQEACPVCTSNKRHIPKLLCQSLDESCAKKPTTITSAPAAWQDASDSEAAPDATGKKTIVPSFVCVGDKDICQYKSSIYSSASSLDDSTKTSVESFPVNPLGNRHIPPYLVNESDLLIGEAAPKWDETSHFPWETRVAHRSAARPTELNETNNVKRNLEDVPTVLCEGCTVTYSTGSSTEDACKRHGCSPASIYRRGEAHNVLLGFSMLPRTLTASAFQDARTTREHQLQAEFLTTPQPAYIAATQGKLAQPIHPNDPRQPSAQGFSCLALNPQLSFQTQGAKLLGSEHVRTQPQLTPNYPTIARAAFDGTDYDSINSLESIHPFGSTELSSTDPYLYSVRTVHPAAQKEIVEEKQNTLARHQFWKLSSQHPVPLSPSSHSAPIPSTWSSVPLPTELIAAADSLPEEQEPHTSLPDAWLSDTTPTGALAQAQIDTSRPTWSNPLEHLGARSGYTTAPQSETLAQTSSHDYYDAQVEEVIRQQASPTTAYNHQPEENTTLVQAAIDEKTTSSMQPASPLLGHAQPSIGAENAQIQQQLAKGATRYPSQALVTDPLHITKQDSKDIDFAHKEGAAPTVQDEAWLALYDREEESPEWLVRHLRNTQRPLCDGPALPEDLITRELGWDNSCSLSSSLATNDTEQFTANDAENAQIQQQLARGATRYPSQALVTDPLHMTKQNSKDIDFAHKEGAAPKVQDEAWLALYDREEESPEWLVRHLRNTQRPLCDGPALPEDLITRELGWDNSCSLSSSLATNETEQFTANESEQKEVDTARESSRSMLFTTGLPWAPHSTKQNSKGSLSASETIIAITSSERESAKAQMRSTEPSVSDTIAANSEIDITTHLNASTSPELAGSSKTVGTNPTGLQNSTMAHADTIANRKLTASAAPGKDTKQAPNAHELGLGIAGLTSLTQPSEGQKNRAHHSGQMGQTADVGEEISIVEASAVLARATAMNTGDHHLSAGVDAQAIHHVQPPKLAGHYLTEPVCSTQDNRSCSAFVGETRVPAHDDEPHQLMAAWVQPSPKLPQPATTTKRQLSPGFNTKEQDSPLGQPGSTQVPDSLLGHATVEQKSDTPIVVKSHRDGSYQFAEASPSPYLSTTNDHLQVTGVVRQSPGTPGSNLPTPVDHHGKEQIGVYIAANKAERSALSLLPSIDDGWAVNQKDIRVHPNQGHSEAHVALNEQRSSGAMARPEHRTGGVTATDAYAKVVDSNDSPKIKSQLGSKRQNKSAPQPLYGKDNGHFSLALAPKSTSKPENGLQSGKLRRHDLPPPSSPAASFLVESAHAAEPPESGVSRESARFFSIGAPTSDSIQRENREDSITSDRNRRLSVGVNDDDLYDDHQVNPESPAGLEPQYSAPTGLGVRRQGRVWDESGPWVEQREEQPQPQWQRQHITERPPRGGPPLSSDGGKRETDERELDVSLQKKNQRSKNAYTYDFEEESSVSAYASTVFNDREEAELFETEDDESVDHIIIIEDIDARSDSAEQAEGQDAATPQWEEDAEPSSLESAANVNAAPPLPNEGIIAQETVIDSSQSDDESLLLDDDFDDDESEGFLINYRDVAINEYIKFVSTLTGKNFVFNSEELDFNITIISEEPTTAENIMAALLQELRIHGLSVMEQGNNIIIHKSQSRSPARILFEGEKDTGETQIITRVFHLDSIEAAKLDDIIKPMLSNEALVQFLPETNNLLVTDISTNVEKIADLIRTLDMPSVTFEIGQYVAKNNFVENLIPLAQDIIRPLSEGQNIVFVPHLATNSVFVVATPQMVKHAIAILERLDSLEGATQIMSLDELGKGVGRLIDADQQRLEEQIRQQTEEQEKREQAPDSDAYKQDFVQDSRRSQERRPTSKEQDIFQDESPDTVQFVDAVEPTIPEDHISQTKFFIHKLQFRSGQQLVDALVRIADSLRLSEKANIDLINAINSIQWIEASNSVVVTGTGEALGHVKELIEEIDTPLRQVFLEMLILDTTVADTLTYSVEYASKFNGQNVGGGTAWSGETPGTTGNPLVNGLNNASSTSVVDDVTSVATALIDPSSLLTSFPGFNIGVIGRRIMKDGLFINTMGGLVKSLRDDTEAEIVLNPKIIVEDNSEAEIFVGENIAYQTQNVVNDDGTIISQNFEFRDVGTLFRVRPQIGNNNVISLDIEQEVSQETTQQSGGSGSGGGGGGGGAGTTNISPGPSTRTSRTITKVHVPDGFFVVLSGMVRDEKQVQRRQVPCLGGIPILGAANSSRSKTLGKRNLMIFIRPQIIETEWDIDEITRRQQNVYKDKGRRRPRWKYEADEGLEFLNLPRINERCDDRCWLPGYTDDWGGTPSPGMRRSH